MSDNNELDNVTDPDETTDTAAETKRENWRRKLEADAEAGREATKEAAQAKRELAFLKAGVDIESGAGKLLAKAYDGDLTAEAVKAAAVEYGIVSADAPQVDPAELAAHDRIAAAASGGTTASDGDAAMSELLAADDEASVLEALAKAGVAIESSRPGRWQRDASMGYVPLNT